MIVRRAVAMAVVMMAVTLAGSMTAAPPSQGAPEAHDSHTMATPSTHMATTGTGVVYLMIANAGDDDDELVNAATDRAHDAQVHETVIENEVGRMVPLAGPLVIPAGESVSLAPGGLHIMLLGLTDDIRLGDTFDLTLEFAAAGEVTIPVTAVLDADDAQGQPVNAGALTIDGFWSRPAPMIDGTSATPATMSAP